MLLYITLLTVFIILSAIAFVIYKIFFESKLIEISEHSVSVRHFDGYYIYSENADVSLQETLGIDGKLRFVPVDGNRIKIVTDDDNYISNYDDGTLLVYYEPSIFVIIKNDIDDTFKIVSEDDRILLYSNKNKKYMLVKMKDIKSVDLYETRNFIAIKTLKQA
jgi:hypothetical protein